MSGVEYAGSSGRIFPVEWGRPPGEPWSETRSAWVRQKVDQHSVLTAHRMLARKQGQMRVKLLRADLMRRRPR